jgi:glutaminase
LHYHQVNNKLLQEIVNVAIENYEGNTANYIPELAHVNKDILSLGVHVIGQEPIICSNHSQKITLQSTAKLVTLIGLLEEFGKEAILDWVNVEPSGDEFASIIRLETFGPKASNPMLNAGALTLCSHIPGVNEAQYVWLDAWIEKLFNKKLYINQTVFHSEKRTGDRNRALAYLLHSRNNLTTSVHQTLNLYFSLCSYEATVEDALYLPTLLANLGKDPISQKEIISEETAKLTLSIMATCGLYDETGIHMFNVGIPTKSGVSGFMLASVPNTAGIVAFSPRINKKGNSIRGRMMLELLAQKTGWHFATRV